MKQNDFETRHIGPQADERQAMLSALGYATLDDMINDIVPANIRLTTPLELPGRQTEGAALASLRAILAKNKPVKSLIGQGYYGTVVPAVNMRNILESPTWYTGYTPYQPEIAQGRLEMLMNFQTMVSSLTGLPVANASLLDEGTAAAEAVSMCLNVKPKAHTIFLSDALHPQTIDVIKTRTSSWGVNLIIGDYKTFDPASVGDALAGVVVQYPDTLGSVENFAKFFESVHAAKALCVTASDLLALCVLKEPAAFGTDICIGSTQRFGTPMGFGGPHAAFMAVTDALKRRMPGRLIGESVDPQGRPGYRLALQTREQHIRREKATSNICTAQVLIASMAAAYAIFHGQEGLKRIATKVHHRAQRLSKAIAECPALTQVNPTFFDTITVKAAGKADELVAKALAAGYNLRKIDADTVAVALDETVTCKDVSAVILALTGKESEKKCCCGQGGACETKPTSFGEGMARTTEFCNQSVFNAYRSETDMMRYLHRLESRDLGLNEAMIPLGSCTMKLNAAAEMLTISWPETNSLHPFAPADQAAGTIQMLDEVAKSLAAITHFDAVCMQPNSGAAGEYAGLMTIRRYQKDHGMGNRHYCLIPTSAHGTNPASAAMAGLTVVPVKCDDGGNIDIADLKAQAEAHRDELACIMVTYPSTHGVYESAIKELCDIVHANGALVYMDGANMNAQVGLTAPGFIGADVCHLNLHKTFALPHGGGGPGVGPICCTKALAPYLPGHVTIPGSTQGAVSSAPYGSAGVVSICWMYLTLMGADSLTMASKCSILNANYIAKKLGDLYPVLYTGNKGLVAHECILDTRELTHMAGITVDDIAKRLMDYGFHAPTMSFPVPGTLMVEPTESEPIDELDRFIEAMRAIHGEIMDIVNGKVDKDDNVLKNAPHTAEAVSCDTWTHPYTRAQAAYPVPGLRMHKFWPFIGRVDNVYGDRNLICTCDTVADLAAAVEKH